MALVEREVYLRNHILGILVSHAGDKLAGSFIGELTTELTETVIDADFHWNELRLCEEMSEMMDYVEDVPQ